MASLDFELTQSQRDILSGKEGEGLRLCMQTLIEYGRVFGAKRLLPIKSAHLTGSFRILTFSKYYEIIERLISEGVKFKVPTTVNPRPGYDYKWHNKIAFRHQKEHEENLQKLGVTPNFSCACYDAINVPEKGDVLAWAESSAVIFANSVIGARTNRNSIMIDICSAATGLTPDFGFLHTENRKGDIHIQLEIDKMDAAALGFLIGKKVVDKVPVIDHYPFSKIEFKNMGGAMAASGSVALYHVVGSTPEASTIEEAFQVQSREELKNIPTIIINQKELDSVRSKKEVQENSPIIAFGCPQMNFDEAMHIGQFFKGKKVKRKTLFHLIPNAYEKFSQTEVYKDVIKAGVQVHQHCPLSGLTVRIGRQQVLTNSGKLFYYLHGTEYGTLEDVLNAAGVL